LLWVLKRSSSHLVGREVGVTVYFSVPLDRTSGSALRCPHEVICCRDHRPLWYPRTLMWELTSCRVWDAEWTAFCCRLNRAVWGVGLRPLACWGGFESHRGHGCLSVVSVVCCQRSLRRADHSSRGVLPTVVRRCVWYKKK
jgi:hypothetical protein